MAGDENEVEEYPEDVEEDEEEKEYPLHKAVFDGDLGHDVDAGSSVRRPRMF